MQKAERLTCNKCGAERWSYRDTVCIMTAGCTGKMQRGERVEQPELAGWVDGIYWEQQQLWAEYPG